MTEVAIRWTDKQGVVDGYAEILASGILTAEQQALVRAGGSPDDVLIQQTSGSSGAPPLRIPRTRAETNWLYLKLLQAYLKHVGEIPPRAAFLGGISHMEADQKAQLDAPITIRNFSGDGLAELDAWDPQFISMYPSFAREIVADPKLELRSLRAIKLGGEKIFRADLERIFARFPGIGVIEQLGSTEMPGIAFRLFREGDDSGYELSHDRFDFAFEPTSDWQAIVVRDRFPGRAFPIEGWFRMDDEARVDGGRLLEIRRAGDRSHALWPELEALYRQRVVNLQLRVREAELVCELAPGATLPDRVALGGSWYRVVRRRPERLVDSNKMPLVLDSQRIPAHLLHCVGKAP